MSSAEQFLTKQNLNAEWWRTAVIYQIYPRSFADADGDGLGDLKGITSRLDSLASLGIDAIWFSPFFKSPQKDAGYDISDYRQIDPIFGSNEDFDILLAKAKSLGLRIIVDIVPNHTSDQHEWFQTALAAAENSAERDYYHFKNGKGENGELPPNNWQSIFGGPAWSRITNTDGTPGQWYLHLFDSSQPDLNWENPKIADEFDEILRFWLDKGVDGFRVDVAHGMVKRAGLPDATIYDENLRERPIRDLTMQQAEEAVPYWGQPGVHDAIRRFRKVIDEFYDRAMCAEASMSPLPRLAMWVRPDEYHQSFNFDYMHGAYEPAAMKKIITDSIVEYTKVGASSTWVMSNHDGIRHATRLGIAPENTPRPGDGIHPTDPMPDEALGLRRARAATSFMLGLPGSSYLYQGEELGLPEAWQLENQYRQDPTFARTAGERVGRDGCRVPLPWEAGVGAANGFNTTGKSWLPQPDIYTEYSRDRQEGLAGSTLELYKHALKLRSELKLGEGSFDWAPEFIGENSLGFRNGEILVVHNFGHTPIELPAGEIIASSIEGMTIGHPLVADQTVWIKA